MRRIDRPYVWPLVAAILLATPGCRGIMGWGDTITYKGDAAAAYALKNPGMDIPQEIVGGTIEFSADFTSEFYLQQDDVLPDGTQLFRDMGTDSKAALGARQSQDTRLVRQHEIWADFGQALGLGLIQGFVGAQGGGLQAQQPAPTPAPQEEPGSVSLTSEQWAELIGRLNILEARTEPLAQQPTKIPEHMLGDPEPTEADEP